MKVLITGSEGRIGKVLKKLPFDITKADISTGQDIRDYETVVSLLKDQDAVVHLAWDPSENEHSDKINPDNTAMYENIYKAALELNVKVIMASSVHVNSYRNWKGGLITVDKIPKPANVYGEHKLEMEKLGKEYSEKGLKVICVRFGGVCNLGEKWEDISIVGLSHPDLLSLVQTCLENDTKFTVIYGISLNPNKVHDLSNPFGWEPKNNAEEFYS